MKSTAQGIVSGDVIALYGDGGEPHLGAQHNV